ncbi:MAG TPA: hypothetical protein PLC21_08145 [Deltaproteobacteria bacterium]|nr:hypothetical protein [Deltaproteobacteria bacterium]
MTSGAFQYHRLFMVAKHKKASGGGISIRKISGFLFAFVLCAIPALARCPGSSSHSAPTVSLIASTGDALDGMVMLMDSNGEELGPEGHCLGTKNSICGKSLRSFEMPARRKELTQFTISYF